ncbi:hypothetical protein [Desulfosarcina sp. BuS5]|uniref:hypothetical protein n=1 Tax=Desulfosarcina sp. BuS5 TaxID=933262 RepID=UPI000685DEF8|nr:hypothetical protein [Desulfosarcina sp. BuS5]
MGKDDDAKALEMFNCEQWFGGVRDGGSVKEALCGSIQSAKCEIYLFAARFADMRLVKFIRKYFIFFSAARAFAFESL